MSRLSPEKKAAWAHHLQTQLSSGLSQQAYCDKHSLSAPQFWYWKRKLQGEPAKKNKQPSQSGSSAFIPVSVADTVFIQGLTVTLPNGIILNGVDEHNHLLVQKMIGVWL